MLLTAGLLPQNLPQPLGKHQSWEPETPSWVSHGAWLLEPSLVCPRFALMGGLSQESAYSVVEGGCLNQSLKC